MTFAIVSAWAPSCKSVCRRVGPDQKAEAIPLDAASPDFAAVKTAIALARKGELAQSSDIKESIGDPVARKVVEWAILRSNEVDFQRYLPSSPTIRWPNIGMLRRRAEAALWKERLDPQIVGGYFGEGSKPAASSVHSAAVPRAW